MVRIPVFIGVAIVPRGHAPVTHQDQGCRGGPRGTVPSPWLLRAPENRRYPIVSNWLAVARNRDDGRTVSWLAALKTAPHRFWLTTEAYPLDHTAAVFGAAVPPVEHTDPQARVTLITQTQ